MLNCGESGIFSQDELQWFGSTQASFTNPGLSESLLCDFWVSHNLSVFSFLKSGDKAPRLFIHLPWKSFVTVS